MVEINNLTRYKIDRKFLEKVVNIFLQQERKKIELSVTIVSEKRIKELNEKYRKKQGPTDILSFRYDSSGEIIICYKVVKENTKIFNTKTQEELARVLIHGLLHIFGYDHEKSKKEAKRMETKQIHYLKNLFKN